MKQLSILETHMSVGAEFGLMLNGLRDPGRIPAQLWDLILMIKAWRANPEGDNAVRLTNDPTIKDGNERWNRVNKKEI